jgi:hypothetical protein
LAKIETDTPIYDKLALEYAAKDAYERFFSEIEEAPTNDS